MFCASLLYRYLWLEVEGKSRTCGKCIAFDISRAPSRILHRSIFSAKLLDLLKLTKGSAHRHVENSCEAKQTSVLVLVWRPPDEQYPSFCGTLDKVLKEKSIIIWFHPNTFHFLQIYFSLVFRYVLIHQERRKRSIRLIFGCKVSVVSPIWD